MASDERFTIDDLVKQILADPALPKLVEQVAEEYAEGVRATFPNSITQTSRTTRKTELFEVVPPDGSGKRPWAHVHVNHPYAVAHQARTGAFTRVAASMRLLISQQGQS